MIRPWINVLAGIWAIFSGFWPAAVNSANFFITGLVIAIIGFWTYNREWQGFVNGIIGIWLIFSAFFYSLVTPGNSIFCGIVVVTLATWRWFSLQKQYPVAG